MVVAGTVPLSRKGGRFSPVVPVVPWVPWPLSPEDPVLDSPSDGDRHLSRRVRGGDRQLDPDRLGGAAGPRRLRPLPGGRRAGAAQLGAVPLPALRPLGGGAHPRPPRPYRAAAAPRGRGVLGAGLLHGAEPRPDLAGPPRRRLAPGGGRPLRAE